MSAGPVTVVIPNRNGVAFLEEAVGSALADAAVGRVVAVDDGSTDGSRRILDLLTERHPDRLRALRQEGGGACVARNAGLALAEGPFVKFLDSDDVLEPGAVGRQVEQLAAFAGQTVSVYGDVRWVNERGEPLPSPPPPPADLPEAARMIEHPPLTAAPLHRVEDVRRVDGFDPRVPRGQEHDLHLRMWLAGVRFVHRPGVVYAYRQHGGGRISDADGQAAVARGRFEALSRHVETARQTLGEPLAPEVAAAFGRQFWRVGRRSLQTGAPAAAAAPFFQTAKRLAGDEAIVGGRAYRLLCRTVGPTLAERLGRRG
ncbi:glycosyltransferase family 2 protein [Alienimonas californiensis]|uniref:Hyaluronan synthase n=1 Tax=Alienimonas californiensis TaxID=2527989 RepID=A0A517P8M6_9PLAN|nr:glycosyltransferase family A protein [Alienimonas californiensis]QDT15722.1 Hyaluronan synthase [Alienimonas californiensis]